MFNCFNFYLLLTTSFLKFSVNSRRISKTSCGSEAAFYRIASDHILDEEPIAKNVTDGLVECIDLCVEAPKCVAMNTHKRGDSKLDCHLLKDDHMSKPRKTISKKGWSLYDTGSKEISRTVGSRCSSMATNPCPAPCTCIDTCHGYECDCYGPEIFNSCRQALETYPGTKLFLWIKPVGMSTAVYAQCVQVNAMMYSILIEHDSEEQIMVKGYEKKGAYQRKFTYPINKLNDIIAFVNASGNCRQHTKIQCINMVIKEHAWLLGRSGQRLAYMGGGPPDGSGCACGITNKCHTPSTKCNCDSNVNTLLVDEGYVTDNSVLPLTEIRLGDTGASSEYGYHTVGKLECFEPFK